MSTRTLNRTAFLQRTAVLGLLAGAATLLPSPASAEPEKRRGLTYRGVCYDTGTFFAPNDPLTRLVWDSEQVRGEIEAIRNELYCNSVTVLGSDLDRLVEAATYALETGLHVLIQPRLFDHPQPDVLDHLAKTARAAERLRKRYPRCGVTLVVGCEHMLFCPGIVPGSGLFERVEYLTQHPEELPRLQETLNAFLAREVELVRPLFGGKLTYAAVADLENVDWSRFDIVGLDYYDFHPTLAGHRSALTPFREWRKPIWILEFGCCTFEGAPELDGMGWNIIDYTVAPPEIPAKYVRSERVQAEYLPKMLGVFDNLGMYGASIYNFIATDVPHASEPRYDLDTASYGLVKVIRKDFSDPASPFRWVRKESFHTVARFNREAC